MWRHASTGSRCLRAALVLFAALTLWTAARPYTPTARAQSPTGYSIGTSAFEDFVRRHGGARNFGYPVSNPFALLGTRVQLFQRHVLQEGPDGSTRLLNLLDPGLLPVTRLNGLTLPAPDPTLAAEAPVPGAADYGANAIAFLQRVAQDEWADRPVGFETAVTETVTCAEAFGEEPCVEGLLPLLAIEVWGLPTSHPAVDPANPNFVYQRFQRGVLHFDAVTGQTQGLLLGDWFKRVLLGVDLPSDLLGQVAGLPFFAQYDPSRPLSLARPDVLAGTNLAGAFRGDDTMVASLLATRQQPVASQPPVLVTPASTPAPGERCWGDERIQFIPDQPYAGSDLRVWLLTANRHDVQRLALAGPVRAGQAYEVPRTDGWGYQWVVAPRVAGLHEFSAYVDMDTCARGAVTVQMPLGATPVPATSAPRPAATPHPTSTMPPAREVTTTPAPTATTAPTATPTPPPTPTLDPLEPFSPASGVVSGALPDQLSRTCGETLTVLGTGFGARQADVDGRVWFGGVQASVVAWSDSAVSILVPRVANSATLTHEVLVSTLGGRTSALYTMRRPC